MKRRNEFDRISTNKSDGQTFYGQDNGDGTTMWWNDRGEVDSISETPGEFELED